MFVELQGYMTRQRIAGVTSYIKASRPGTKFGDTALYTILQLKSGAKGLPDLE